MMKAKLVFLGCSALLATAAVAAELATQSLRVEVRNLRNTRGDVGCGLFASADGFPDTDRKAVQSQHVPIHDKTAVCEFVGVKPGTYAVAVFHDENGNGVLDKNLLGMPKEGYGTSNDVRPAMSAPTFQPASFVVRADAPTTLIVQMGY